MDDYGEEAMVNDLRGLKFTDLREGQTLINVLTRKVNELDPTKFQEQVLASRVRLLLDLLIESFAGRYQDLSLLAFVRIIVALDYFLRTDDETPDTLAGGYSDDLAVIQKVFTDFSHEIEAFEKWQSRQPSQ